MILGLLHGILLVPENIVMNFNNVMNTYTFIIILIIETIEFIIL